mgnify:CR=1 FL=1
MAGHAVHTVAGLVGFEVSAGGELFHAAGVVAGHTNLNTSVGQVTRRKNPVFGMTRKTLDLLNSVNTFIEGCHLMARAAVNFIDIGTGFMREFLSAEPGVTIDALNS